jgi:starch phosphorylase
VVAVLDDFTLAPRIAYFSMEMALRDEIPTYAGGLGILAGDTLRSCAELSLPVVGVSLASRRGYFRQRLSVDGRQSEEPVPWNPAQWAQRLDARVAVRIEGRPVWVGAWLYVLECMTGGSTPVILLDTDLDDNAPVDRAITDQLYGGDDAYRFKQEIVLGIGGARLLTALGFEIKAFHMNEGHSALLGLELLRRHSYRPDEVQPGELPYNLPKVRELCRFTTHTPVDAGHDRFAYDLVERLLSNGGSNHSVFADLPFLRRLGGVDKFNMTRLALNLSEVVNGVAKKHAEVSAAMFPGHAVRAITNGVHPLSWTSPAFRELYDQHVPGWCHEPELLTRVERIPDSAILAAHTQAKQTLIDTVGELTGVVMHAKVPILGFARRMTAYKRPDLLFTDIERLKAIARERSLQIVLAGKAHPHDEPGKKLISLLHEQARALAGSIPVAYLPDYGMALARVMVAGSDIWVNTPLPPLEASGTSGMKAAFNGVPSLSVLDGWWIEGCLEGITGWAIDDANSLYDKLENVILPLYYGYSANPGGWTAVMRGAISKNASYFNSHRMMRRYATESYLR